MKQKCPMVLRKGGENVRLKLISLVEVSFLWKHWN